MITLMEKRKVGDSIGKSVPDGCYTVAQVAILIGRHRDTVTEWRRTGRYVPTHWKRYGMLKVGLYTDEDIAAMKLIAETTTPGRRKSGDD